MRSIATILAGSWRLSPLPPAALPADELTRLAPLLHALGVAPLAWWRLRHSALNDHAAMPAMQDAFRHSRVHQAVLEKLLADGVRLLDEAQIDAIVAKGPVIARCYAEAGLRPFNDLDLSVPADRCVHAAEVLARVGRLHMLFDVQPGFHGRIDRTADELNAHAQSVEIGGARVRVLGPEDELRLITCHLLADGVRLPLALVDVAAFLDTLPATFDWEYCLSGSPQRTQYVLVAIALAVRLVGAPIEAVPEQWRPVAIPDWVERAVLDEWQRTAAFPDGGGWLLQHVRRGSLLTGVRLRWPNPVRAAVRCEAPIDDVPRLRWQIRNWVERSSTLPRKATRRRLDARKRARADGRRIN